MYVYIYVTRLGRGTLNTCNFSGSYLSKTAWALKSGGIWGDKLEPACTCYIHIHAIYCVQCTVLRSRFGVRLNLLFQFSAVAKRFNAFDLIVQWSSFEQDPE